MEVTRKEKMEKRGKAEGDRERHGIGVWRELRHLPRM